MADKPKRFPATRRVHEDGSTCTHKITSNGKPAEGQDCPGPTGYVFTCPPDGCADAYEVKAGTRAYVDERRRYHLRSSHF
ncbi:hypothetical protein ACQP10_38225 (plasmid) [Streptosporangium sandarakinum]|uniref:hypothetical protein n=1 Tax=Streptosporangium sandarakinum TaxID=1260955 RepID=UPI003D8FD94B